VGTAGTDTDSQVSLVGASVGHQRHHAPGQALHLDWDHAFQGQDIVRFLKHLLRRIAGQLLLIWDGLPAHRGQVVKQFLRQGAAKRLHLAQLPSYAPDLNPNEGVWGYLKTVELANVGCHDLAELRYQLRQAIARLRHKSTVIQSFFRQARLVT
jgi:transposase